ncbi:MAG TPA: nuclear transport factor 2 family protein [Phenylobacterium sp.]|nr:nuclear transport factor 2 family protein [Phenylobacterium sp.]
MPLTALALSAALAAAAPVEEPATEAGVRHAEELWTRATIAGDVATLEALLAPDYVSVNAQATPRPRAEILESAKTFPQRHPDAKFVALPPTSTIQVEGRAAVVRHNGEADRSVDVFYYDGHRWRAWYSQHTALPKPA